MKVVDNIHSKSVHTRRVNKLCEHLSDLIPHGSSVLDVGCGDGLLSSLIMQKRTNIKLSGVDVLVRSDAKIPVAEFDGESIPFQDKSFDIVMFVDVLHHTDNPEILLREAVRVANHAIVIKDHTRNGFLAYPTLRFMDWVGNAKHNVALPYNYWSAQQWTNALNSLNLQTEVWIKDLGLYPKPADWIFGRSLHFIAKFSLIE